MRRARINKKGLHGLVWVGWKGEPASLLER
jgi:hypothetical protein